MTARTKVTLEEAAEVKAYLVDVVLTEVSTRTGASAVVDALFAQGVIDVDAALRHARETPPT